MASINLTKLKPGKTYIVKARAVDADGNYSQYSFSYSFTVPATNVDGTQLVSINNSVVTRLVTTASFNPYNNNNVQSGAITVGPLDSDTLNRVGGINLLDYWNGSTPFINYYISGSPNRGTVIINESGILGAQINSGGTGTTPKFLLSTDTGDAYFAGTLSAPNGLIGGFNIGSTRLYNTDGTNTISMNSSASSGYPNFSIVGASSSLTISGDTLHPYISFINASATDYSNLYIRYGDIGSPDFGPTASNNSRGEILFWNKNSSNPNQITIRRFGETGSTGPDGIAFIDLQTDAKIGTPDKSRITIQSAQSLSTGISNDISPNDNESVKIELYKSFGDTSSSTYPAYLTMSVNESGSSNITTISSNKTTFTQQIIGTTGSFTGRITASAFTGNGASLTNIPPRALTASSITIGTTTIGLGASTTTLYNLTGFSSENATINQVINAGSFVGDGSGLTGVVATSVSGSITIGNTVIPLGTTASSLTGLSSISTSAQSTIGNINIGQRGNSNNVIIGNSISTTYGSGNTSVGIGALNATGGSATVRNTVVGYNALSTGGGTNTDNIIIGYQAFSTIGATYKNIIIGNNAGTDSTFGGASGVVVIGGYTGSVVAPLVNHIIIADGVGNVRITAASTGLVTIPGTASIVGQINAASFIGSAASLSGRVIAASFTGDGSGLTGVTPSGSITIGTTAIPLNSSTSSIGGLNNIASTSATLTNILGTTASLSGTITAASIIGNTGSFTGRVTASAFVGDGSGLTGVTAISTSSNQGLSIVYSASFAAASAVAFDNIFTSTYRNYRIVIEPSANVGQPNYVIKFRKSGTSYTPTGNQFFLGSTYSTTSSAGLLNNTQTYAQYPIIVDFFAPAIGSGAQATFNGQMMVGGPTSGMSMFFQSGTSGSAYDGIQLLTSTASGSTNTVTGIIKVYGYAN